MEGIGSMEGTMITLGKGVLIKFLLIFRVALSFDGYPRLDERE